MASQQSTSTSVTATTTASTAAETRKLDDPLYYADYLHLATLLNCQHPKSDEIGKPAHDELLFITTHQAYELWFKQILHELDSIRKVFMSAPVEEKWVGVAVARLQRVREIQNILLQQISVLETMSPLDFLDFRDRLYPASGFQSVQFRLVENKLGIRPETRLSYGSRPYCTYLNASDAQLVAETEKEPSLATLVEQWLERTPFVTTPAGSGGAGGAGGAAFSFWDQYRAAVDRILDEDERCIRASMVERGDEGKDDEIPAIPAHVGAAMKSTFRPATDEDRARLSHEQVQVQLKELQAQRDNFACILDPTKYAELVARGDRHMSYRATQAALMIMLYGDEPLLTLPARLLSILTDIDEQFTAWRYRHALMVHRMLGIKIGTGGSSGYHYLRATAERHKAFSDITNLSTFLIPRASLPALPAPIRRTLAFAFTAAAGGCSHCHCGCGESASATATAASVVSVTAEHSTAHCNGTGAAASSAAPHPVPAGMEGARCPITGATHHA